MNSKEHNRLIGIFLLAHGSFQTLIMLFVAIIYGVIGAGLFASARREEEQMIGLVFVVAIAFVVLLSLAFTIPQIIGGWKLYKETPNARTWGIIASIVACMSFPLGTAAGVYGLWFLFGEDGKRFYENPWQAQQLGRMNAQSEFQYNTNREHQPHNWR
ncbi:MAG TPA: hypothetical protein PKE69_16600 [Pyrinomonadaceae bacterium]|nr:hypothetical protein [Pyrinomonadaceae bacterium]